MKFITRLIAVAFALACAPAYSQLLINCAPSTPCTSSGPENTGTGDAPFLAGYKINYNFQNLASWYSPPFNTLSTGTNTTGTMTVGTGATLKPSSATAGVVSANQLNGTSLAGLATGLLKNTTATGVPSIAAAADVYGVFGCSGSSTTFLNGAGGCTTPSGGSSAFNSLTSGTNTTATMQVGSGASIGPTSSSPGTVNANQVNGAAVPASAAVLASNSSSQLTALTLGNNLTIASGTLQTTQAINAQTGTTYPIATTDAGKLITRSNASSCADTLPAATTTGYTAGYAFDYQNVGTASCTITPTTSTINTAASLTVAPNAGCTITSDGANYQVSACTAVLSASGAPTVITTFTASGTWTNPGTVNGYSPKTVRVIAIGGGGGGGGGALTASGTAASGGGSGGGGGYMDATFAPSDLTSSVTVTVGAAGTAGSAATTSATAGGAGGLGGTSSFGTYVYSSGGGGGSGGQISASSAGGGGGLGVIGNSAGTATSASGSTAGNSGSYNFGAAIQGNGGSGGCSSQVSMPFQASGGCGSTVTGSSTGSVGLAAPAAGGTGGSVTTVPAATSGGNGGVILLNAAAKAAGGGANTAGGTATLSFSWLPGNGGGGGGGGINGTSGAGGAGARGGGGGGGGSNLNGYTAGAGGAGGAGYVVVITSY